MDAFIYTFWATRYDQTIPLLTHNALIKGYRNKVVNKSVYSAFRVCLWDFANCYDKYNEFGVTTE